MPTAGLLTTEDLLRTYFHAKDENRPHLMEKVFAEDASLVMQVKSDAITFPAATQGCEAITDVLVRKFNQTYENIYSFYLQRPAAGDHAERFSCDWMVIMSDKESRNLRVGCGRYDWGFQTQAPFLVKQFRITIEAMQVLPPSAAQSLFGWQASLPYPWCSTDIIVGTAPRIEGLDAVLAYLARA